MSDFVVDGECLRRIHRSEDGGIKHSRIGARPRRGHAGHASRLRTDRGTGNTRGGGGDVFAFQLSGSLGVCEKNLSRHIPH